MPHSTQSPRDLSAGATIASRVVLPSDCILAFGIPTSEAAFRRDLVREDKDFAKAFGVWGRYRSEVVGPLNRIRPHLDKFGVRVMHNLTLTTLNAAASAAPIVILFSHWLEDEKMIELADGFKNITAVSNAIPSNFEGILDLCVCRSDSLAAIVRATHPRSLVRFVPGREVTPSYWLYFLLVLFRLLANEPLSYLSAVERAVKAFVPERR